MVVVYHFLSCVCVVCVCVGGGGSCVGVGIGQNTLPARPCRYISPGIIQRLMGLNSTLNRQPIQVTGVCDLVEYVARRHQHIKKTIHEKASRGGGGGARG